MAEDLDALIGEIRREAARRRAAPDFPIDEEARLAVEMDGHGPSGPGVDLAAVLARLEALARAARAGHGGGPAAPRFARRRSGRNTQGGGPDGALTELIELTASAVRGLAARTADLERRLNRARSHSTGTGRSEDSDR
ncbi:MAG: hypothetical protein JO337_08485 [Acidimicrobiales bacterium]|nr:hypothetical protein [Acidimicrobiales bacterium]